MARTILGAGQSVTIGEGTNDVFGTSAGAERVTVLDNTIVTFGTNFNAGGDTIRLTGLAANFTIRQSGSFAIITSASDGITINVPIGNVGTTIVFENSSGGFTDDRTLIFNGTNVLLDGQVVTGSATQIVPDGGNNGTNNIVLTAGVDTTPGGSADDTFIGFNRTLNAGDKLDGGAGYNTLSLSTDTALTGIFEGPYTYGGFTTVNIQRIEVTNDDDQPITLDLSGTKGVETVVALNSSQDISFTQLTSLNANGADIELNNVTNGTPNDPTPDVNVQYQDSVVAGANTVVDVVIKTSNADNLKIGSVSDANGGIETVNLSNEQGPSTIDTLDTDLTTLNIKATQNLKIDDALNNTVRTIDASASTATVDIDFSDNDAGNQDVTYIGSSGIDIVEAGNADDSISTGTGDDTVNAAGGNNFVDAGEGANSVTSGGGSDTIRAGAGNDTISSGGGDDDINAGDGANSVNAGSGNDTVRTGAGADTINAGSGDDSVDSGAGDDSIFTGSGFDTVIAGDGNDTVTVAAGEFDADGEVVPLDSFSFGGGTDELRIDQSVGSAEAFTNVSSLEVLTQTGANHNLNLNDGGDADTINEAQVSGIQIINTDWNYVGNDTVNAGGFTSNLTVNIGGYTGDTDGVGGGIDSIVTGSGDDTIKAPGDNNIRDNDTIRGGAGSDTLILDGDTTLTTASNFSQIEKIVLLEEEQSVDWNRYEITLDNDNAPTANGTLTIDGNVLLSDEGVFISSDAVTNFAMSVIGGAGNDFVTSGVQGDTIQTGAGADYVNIELGGNDSVDLGTGNDLLEVGGELTSGDTVNGGDGNDTIDASDSTRDIVDADFTNVSNVEEFWVAEGKTSTLAAEAQEAGIRTIRSVDSTSGTVIDASAYTVGVTVYVEGSGAGNNDVVKTGSGNDTIYGGEGIQNYITGDGDDQVIVTGSELTNFDSYAGGAGNDSVILDNTGGAVTAKVNLTNFSDVENFTILANGDVGNDGFADVDDNSLTFTGGNVGTLTQIRVDASALTDQNDSFTMTLAAGQTDADFQFNVFGSSTETNIVKRNVGTNNNINFHGGTGVDSLFINGSDLGSTVTMDGGDGLDRIVQTQQFGKTALTDDAFVNISNVEILTGEDAGDLNATLGFEADQAGIVRIDDTAGDDKVTFDAAFNNATTVNLSGGNDTINALASAAVLTINALDSNLTTGDQITGGTTVNDVLNVSAGNGIADLRNVTKVETIKVIDTDASTTLIVDTTAADLSPGATHQTIDASDLDAPSEMLILQGATASANLSVLGGGGGDQITTGTGNDTVNAGEGDNTVVTGNGNDSVTAGAGNDSIVTGDGNDKVNAGNGNNTVFAGNGDDSIVTGSGNDIIDDGAGNDTVSSGAGNDQIYGAGGADVIDTGTGNDQILYRARMESSTSTARDTVTGFTSGSDVIDTRYVAEAIANYGEGAKINFAGNLGSFGDAQGATIAGDKIMDIVYDTSTGNLWVDLNDDGTLNGNDLQIVLQGVPTLQAKDVLDTLATGAVVGATLVPSGTSVTGTFLDDRFLLQGVGPWTVDGGLGNDTVVIKNQDISTSNISNVEIAEIDGSATMTYKQHNTFANLTDGKNGPQTVTLVSDIYAVTGKAAIETYVLNGTLDPLGNTAGDDFTLGASGQNVFTGVNNDVIRTGAIDLVTGRLDGGAGTDRLILDAGDDISGANLWDIEETLITESSVKMNAAQHGSNGTDGNAGTILDDGDTFPNSTDTITITTSTLAAVAASATNQKAFAGTGITGVADIENYVLSDGDDKFTLGIGSQNVNTGLGVNEIVTGASIDNITGTLGGAGANDTLTLDDNDNIGGVNDGASLFGVGDGDSISDAANTSAIETLNLTGGTVSMTVAQHEAFTAITDNGVGTNIVNLTTGGTVNAEVVVDEYVANGNSNTTFVVNAGNADVNITAFDSTFGSPDVFEDTIVVNGFAVNGTWFLEGTTDTLTATSGTDVSGVNGGNATTAEILNLTGDISATEKQHDAFTTINAGGTNTFTLTDANGDGAVTGNAAIETYVLNDAFTFTLGAAAQNVTGDGANAQTVIVNGLAITGTLDGGTGAGDPDTLVLNTGSDITGVTSITNFENVTVNGSVTMKYGQYNTLQPTGGAGVDTINFVGPVAAVTARNAIENYILANIAGNDFSFANGTGTVSVTTSGSNNDIVRTGTQTSFVGVTLDLAGNTGFVGDQLIVTTDNTDLSGINGGNETTAETLELGAGFTVSMTVDQHEGFTAPFIATGNETVVITDAGLINAEESIENYDLSAAANTIVVNELNGAVNIKDTSGTGDNDRVVINANVVATGTWDLQNANDVLEVNGTSTKISGVNGGLATTAEELELTGLINNLTLTQVQHEAFTTTTATAGVDTLIILGAGTVTAFDNVENYNLSNAANTLIVNANETNVNVLAIGGSSDTINVGGNKVGGNWNLGALADTVVAANGADISGVNGGAATTAEFIQIANNANVTMTTTQHEGFAADLLGGFTAAGTNTITFTNDGTINGRGQVEGYVLNANGGAGSTVNLNDNLLGGSSNFNVSITGADGADTVVINGNFFSGTLNVGGTWALAGTDDTLVLNNSADITAVNAGAATTAETLTIQAASGNDATMTVAQHNAFTTVNAAGGGNAITLKTDGTLTAFAAIESYVLNNDGGAGSTISVNSGNTAVSITGASGSDTVDVGGLTVTGKYALTGADDTLTATNGANISGVNGGNVTTAETLNITDDITLTGKQYNGFTTVNGAGTSDGVTITTGGTYTAFDAIEDYVLQGNSTITFAGADTVLKNQSVDLGSTASQVVITTAAIDSSASGTDSSVTISNFTSNDVLNINVGANDLNTAINVGVAATSNTNIGNAEVVVINGLASVNLTDIGNGGQVEQAIAQAIGTADVGAHLFVLESPNGGGQSGLYLVNVSASASAAGLDTSNFDVEFIGLVNHANGFDWTAGNFA